MCRLIFSCVLTLFFITLVQSNIVQVSEPKALPAKKWWQHANFYQLYPRSFKDSNGDGIGDLRGMISHLDHLKELGITATWLSPIFASPQVDLGYDVSDFYTIDESYGNMTDFENLIKRAHELGIKLMLDYIPNHTSDKHQWFIDSVNKTNGKDDYYVWRNGKNGPDDDKNPPNNWVSVFSGPAWTYREERKQWYLHQFTKQQPDLNYRHPAVLTEMTNVIKFYLDKGVDGFRLDAINHMYEDNRFLDEPKTGWTEDENSYDYLEHIYTKDQNETYNIVYQWREFLDNYVKENNLTEDKILMTEAYASIEDTMRYYESKDGKQKGAHMPFNFALIFDLANGTTAQKIKSGIDNWLTHMPNGNTPSWVIGSHDHSRLGSRFGTFNAELANVILMTLPGTSITYYGEEIGMVDNKDFTPIYDDRDHNRTPLQWDNSTNAGFTQGNETWLPIHKNYRTVNIETVKSSPNSIFNQYIQLTKLRTHPTFLHGDFHSKAITTNVIAFIRELLDYETHITVANIAATNTTLDLTVFPNLPDKLHIVFTTSNSKYKIGEIVDTNNVSLEKYDAVILRSRATTLAKLSTGLLVIVLLRCLMAR